jgi:hypothetical protein
MVNMCVCDEDGIDAGAHMGESFTKAEGVWLDALIEGDRAQGYAAEVRIDEERMAAGLELVAIHTEVGDADSAFPARRIGDDVFGMVVQAGSRGCRGDQEQSEECHLHWRDHGLREMSAEE